jgi:hypothetical protein
VVAAGILAGNGAFFLQIALFPQKQQDKVLNSKFRLK